MNKLMQRIPILVCLMLVLGICPRLYADDPVSKLGHGLEHIILSPMELAIQTTRIANDHGSFVGGFGGLIYGIGAMAVRIGGGVYDVVTFPIPWPRGYRSIIPWGSPPETLKALSGK